ncbi:hypothetical protein AAG570_006112 [Ranatra chinensis]|uniref:Uncharacterized protein n=1 Tax=Ranatra chinensis TaxID=642074 RepID=A0ABD0XX36_9HEMI
MASKRRNMFYKNKKQESTEIKIIRQQASVAEQIDCQESASGTKDASRGIGTKPIAPTADSGDTPSRTGEQDLFGENQSMGKEELEDGPKEACGSPEDEDTAIEQESSEKCGPGGECPQASDEGRTLDQINVKDNDVDEEFRTLPETQHHSTLESEMLIKSPKGIYRSYTRWRQTLYLADSEVAQHSLEKGHVINLDTAIEQESSEKCGPGGECPQASDEGRTLDQINVKDNDVDEEFRTLPETQHHSTLESEMLIKSPKGIYRSYTRWRQTLYLADSEVAQHSLEKGHVINLDTAIEQESSEKCGPGGECPQASDEGRTSSKRSNARVDGPNLRSPPVSEDWEEKEVPYSDGDNRRHCTLDQINVKDNDVDEEFRTLPETQHHSTLENPAEIIRQQASVAEQIDCQESASGTKDASRGIGTKPIAPTADSGDTPSRTGEQDLFGENQSMGKEELEDGPKEACGSPEDEDTAIEQESSEKCGPGGECPQASDEETSSEPGCEKTNTRRVGKKILNGGKRKNGTKQIPEETEKIPEHAARKKRDPKLEALRLMMEERQKEAFEKTKERTRPGINPKYHYLNQKKPAQNVIEGAVPAPLRPAAKRRLAKPVSKKKRDPKVEAMRLAEKERQEEAFEEAKLRRRPGINPKYHYLNRKRPGRGDELAQTEGRGAAAGGKPVEEPGAGSWAMSFKQRKMGPRQNTNNHQMRESSQSEPDYQENLPVTVQGVPVADRQWIPRSTDSLSEVEDTVDHHPSSRVMKPKTVCKKPKKIAARNIEEELKGGRNKTAKLPNKGVPVADRQWIPRSTDSLSDVEDTVDHHPSSRVMKPKTVCKKPKKIVAKNIKEELKAGRNKTAKFPNEVNSYLAPDIISTDGGTHSVDLVKFTRNMRRLHYKSHQNYTPEIPEA